MSLGNVKYLAVCRSADAEIIAEHLESNKNYMTDFVDVIQRTLESPNGKQPRLVINVKSLFTCYFIRFGECHYFAMTSPTYNKMYSWQMLQSVAQAFSGQFRDRIPTAGPRSLNHAAKQLLQTAAKNFDDPIKVDRVARLQQVTNETIDLMAQNIDQLIANNTKVEDLERQAEALADDGLAFREQSHKVKKEGKKANRRSCIMIGAICGGVVLVILIIVLATTL